MDIGYGYYLRVFRFRGDAEVVGSTASYSDGGDADAVVGAQDSCGGCGG